MSKRLIALVIPSIFILTIAIGVTGCQQKTEKPADEEQTQQAAPDTVTQGSYPPDTTADIPQKTFMDLKGTWSGKFDQRNTTLTITSQDSLNFSGKITIRYREVINQEVKGSVDPEKKSFKMSDQLHSRYRGKYSGIISDDGTSMEGTFTMDVDGKNYSFSLSKKQ